MEFCKFKIPWRLLPALAAPLCACALGKPTPPDEVVFALSANPTQLDPRFSTDSFSEKIGQLIFRGLVRKDENSQTVLDLAATLSNPDPLTWRFTLHEGVRFHDGTPLTSRDVVYTFQSIMDPESRSIRRLTFENVSRIDAPDPYTVVFHLKEPFAPLLENLTVGIVPEAAARALGEGFQDVLIGTGPFRFVTYVKDQYIRLEANPLEQADPPRVQRLTFKIVPDATVRALELIHGSVDMTQNDMPAFLLPELRARPGLKLQERDSLLVKYLGFNLRDPLLSDVRVRRAIAQAIDRDEIVRYKYRGFATPTHSILSPPSFAYDADLPGYPFDPAAAKQLLDAAGYPDPDGAGPAARFRLVYKTSLDDQAVAVARVFRAQMRKVDIDLQVQTNEWGVFFEDIKQGDFQLYSLTAVGVHDPDYLAHLLHSNRIPPAGINRARYRNPRMDTLLEEGQRTLDREARRRVYKEVQRLMYEDLPYLPLWNEKNVAILNVRLSGFAITPNGDFQSLSRVEKHTPTGRR